MKDIVHVRGQTPYIRLGEPMTREEGLYLIGFTPRHYPLPVPYDVADTSINWTAITHGRCPLGDPCAACIEDFMDGLVSLQTTVCKGLLGECINCKWPECEHG